MTTGTNNIALGAGSGSSITTETNTISIGASGISASNTTYIGNNSTTAAYIEGIDGVNVGSVAKVVTMASDQLGTATITAGAGIAVSAGANTITIAATGGGFAWANTTVNASIVAESGYIANKAGLLTMTLPASPALGDEFAITNINTAVGFRIAQNALQQMRMGTSTTTIGITGYLEATALGDTLTCVCTVAGTSARWVVISSMGNITVV